MFMDYKNVDASDIYLKFKDHFDEIENSFRWLDLSDEEYKKIVVKETINLQNEKCDNKNFKNLLLSNIKKVDDVLSKFCSNDLRAYLQETKTLSKSK